MVEAQTRQNTFWLWSDVVNFTRRGDFDFWSPEYVKNDKLMSQYSPFREVVEDITNGVELRKYSDTGELYLRVGNIKEFFTDLDDIKLVPLTREAVKVREKVVLSEQDILMSRSGSLGIITVVTPDIKNSIISSHIMRLRVKKEISPYYITTFLNSSFGKNQILRRRNGSPVPEINHQSLEEIRFFIPSKTIQQKVEQIVKEAFQLKTEAESEYQQAVDVFLKNIKTHISEWDDLTNETQKAFWLWSDQVDITNRIDPDYYSGEGIRNKLGKIKPLADLAEIKIGKTPAFDDYLPSGKRRIMKFRAITGRGIDLENEERGFVKEEFFQKNKRNKLNEDDIVLGSAAHQAHYIGKYLDIVDELPKEFADGVLTVAEIMTIRVDKTLNPFVLLLFLRSSVGYELIQRQIKGQTSHLYPKDVASIGIPEAVIKISKSKIGVEIEGKVQSSLAKARLSKQKLQEAKDFVENLVKTNEK